MQLKERSLSCIFPYIRRARCVELDSFLLYNNGSTVNQNELIERKKMKRHSIVYPVHQNKQSNYQKSQTFVDDVVVLDFETTGLSPERNEIIQIGAIKFEQAKMVDQFAAYAKASRPIPAKITQITGITNETVKDAPALNESLLKLRDFIGDYPIVAHNASFDLKFLLTNYHRYDISYPAPVVIDTLTLARKYIRQTPNHKLTTLKQFLRMEAQSHDAIEDCKVTGQLYYYCKIIQKRQKQG